jgi:hypothetical protein
LAAIRALQWAALCTTLSGLALAQSPATSDTVYRCGPDGGSYSVRPCPDGRTVSVDDGRTGEQISQAREVARRERALADKMTAERLAMESRAPAPPINLTPHSGQAKPAASKRPPKNKQRRTRLAQQASPAVGPSASKSHKASKRADGTAPTAAKRRSSKSKTARQPSQS